MALLQRELIQRLRDLLCGRAVFQRVDEFRFLLRCTVGGVHSRLKIRQIRDETRLLGDHAGIRQLIFFPGPVVVEA